MNIIPTTIFIVPQKNRPTHKKEFIKYFNRIINENKNLEPDTTQLFFINQNDKRQFNRGGIKNIGFLIVKNLYPNDYKNITLIFHDIDTIPNDSNLLNYKTDSKTIYHYYGFVFVLGGMFSIKASDFELIKGFPNFWGWGSEDNVILDRAIKNNITIDRSNFFDYKTDKIIRFNDENKDFISNLKLINKREMSMYINKEKLDDLTDIKNLNYTEKKNIDNYNIIDFDINNFETSRSYKIEEFQFVNYKKESHNLRNILRGWFRKDWNMFRNLK